MPQSGDNDIEANYLVEEHDEKHIDVPFFSFESILAATDNFSKQNKLGQGGFGPVYKGEFQGGQEIAVKRLSSESTQGINEFKNEVELIAKLQHRNLVRLLGYCIKGKEQILLYEYMQNKSLDTFIFDEERSAVLDWEKRFEIIRGIARGLMYLHHDSRLRIIHRDMKTSNILLDEEMNPRISDFGLARIVEGKRTEAINTNRVAGTYGYMSPEYALDGLFSTKSDVFSFGVVMLEIITGRRSSGFYDHDGSSNLLGYAWRLWNEGKIRELVQKSLLPIEAKHESEVFKCINVGLLCVQEQAGDRPSMPNALVMMLSTESTNLPRPNQPAFITRTGMSPATSTSASSGLPQNTHSRNELSVTVFEGRLYVIFNSPISLGDDTLTVNDNLSLTTTIVSSNGRFEMGFFTPGKTANYYAGIWYNQIEPQTVIWVANRDTPISFVDMASTTLKISDGNLVLVNVTGGLLWSTNAATSGGSKNSLRATLLNTGNLVLIDGNSTDEAQPLWQSFDHPTDTTMAGAKFGYNKLTGEKQTLRSWKSPEDPSPGLYSLAMDPQIWQFAATWNGTDRYWTSGPANGSLFKLVPEMRPNPIYNFTFVNNANQTFFVYEFFNPDAVISRFVLDISGQLRHYTWLDSSKAWNILFLKPEKQCDVPAVCGPFGMCNDNSTSLCDCLPGFRRKSDKDWGLKVFSGGCVRKADLQCGNATGTANSQEDRFRMITNTRLPRHPRNVTVGSTTECESACLRNCSCNAYAYDDRNGGCSHWDGELLNLYEDNSNGSTIYIRLAASEFFVQGQSQVQHLMARDYWAEALRVKSRYSDLFLENCLLLISTDQNQNKVSAGKLKVIIPVTVASLLLVACIFTYICYTRRKGKIEGMEYLMSEEVHDERRIDVPFFSFESILVATDNFSDENKLGRGGFGPVYKGEFQDGKEIAVKRLSSESSQGINEFKNEVELIARLQHRNLVRLLGYCIKGKEKILLYEYMQHKSLDTFIFDQERSVLLDWENRFDIILGIARGLMYLHHDSRLRIIHRDMKTSNILLDSEMNPKISDFGLARILEGRKTEAVNTIRVAGTYGYMSPEYASDGLFSIKSDVFSFGVIMLEIITGRRSSGFYHPDGSANLLAYAWKLWNEGQTREFVHESLIPLEPKHEREVLKCIHISLLCVQERPEDRPRMPTVLTMLNNETCESLSRPNQPAFVPRTSMPSTTSTSSSSSGLPHSNNEVTLTVLEGR
ncbi:G-type lectin S-receptor-like serine/threonine-protein kinase At1g11300 [Ipomoea triloba]|uniref:G-type lectin S-receptor-like serine/threonine-protein kinase At1g11300 n=1 Tax=Ipomoea triloba TaxID=35885 RepID=UPI00125DA35A|nr:G-type lectin S-receptor-like serine/threonine-protein kinase At1g11300 [Ipomoea triloba]